MAKEQQDGHGHPQLDDEPSPRLLTVSTEPNSVIGVNRRPSGRLAPAFILMRGSPLVAGSERCIGCRTRLDRVAGESSIEVEVAGDGKPTRVSPWERGEAVAVLTAR